MNPHKARQTQELSSLVTYVRLCLYNRGYPCGAKAILAELDKLDVRPLPSPSSIYRILRRNGLTNGRTGLYDQE